MILPVLLALLSYFGWSIGDTISIKLFRKNDPEVITFFSGFGRILLLLIFLPFYWKEFSNITVFPLLFNIVAGLSSGFGYYLFGKAARRINPAIVSAVTGGWGGSTLILSLIFFNEALSLNQWLSVGVIFFGLFLTTFNFQWFKDKKLISNRGFLYAIASFLLWGVCGAFLKAPALQYGWYWTTVFLLVPYFVVLFFTSKERLKTLKTKISYPWLFLLMIIFIIIADFSYSRSFQTGGTIAIVGTIAGSYATFSTFLLHLIYKESLTRKQTVGIIISLIGIVMTAYFSSIS